MTDRPPRVIDAHVHLWDPERTDWYPYLARSEPRMGRRFDMATYREEAAGWNVEKVINVAAATGLNSVAETIDLDQRAEAGGGPDAIIGGLPPTGSVSEAIDLLDRQMAAPRFRGVRAMGGLDRPVPDADVLRAMEERSLVLDLMARPDQLRAAADRLERTDRLAVVVEHTGWPRADTAEERALWREGMRALAGLGARVACKLSGLAMPFESVSAEALGPWIEEAIDLFGAERCLFASNFPVDSVHGTFDELYSTFAAVTAGLDGPARAGLFADNAERIYRLNS
ncbi:MAG TPA: amidohydrolase family protein [Acidimicrobiales bacterium]|nr:amidohydrolase family protein [Acidimicrobiales bacterium]